jgi:hypothetical protein
MKIFLIISLFFILSACAAPQVKYAVPVGQQAAYDKAVKECFETVKPTGNPFQGDVADGLFMGFWDIPKYQSRLDFKTCLEAKGFKCIENCPFVQAPK